MLWNIGDVDVHPISRNHRKVSMINMGFKLPIASQLAHLYRCLVGEISFEEFENSLLGGLQVSSFAACNHWLPHQNLVLWQAKPVSF